MVRLLASSQEWVDDHDMGCVVFDNDDTQTEIYDIFDRTRVPIPTATAYRIWPTYDCQHVNHSEVGTRADLPSIFQIQIYYEPYYPTMPHFQLWSRLI